MNDIQKLMKYDEAYEIGNPLISDREYDLFKSKTRVNYPRHPYFQIVGAPVKGEKVKLPVVLGSLNKVKSTDGSYDDWCRDNKGAKIYWSKLDGVSIYKEYENGRLVKAYTRGNGEYGRDITTKAFLFCPIEVDDGFTGEVRGEVMLVGDSYKEMGYTTRRNGAAGLINQDELTNVDQLVVKTYELISDSKGVPKTEWERVGRLESLFDIAPCIMEENDLTQDQLIDLLVSYRSYGYDVDGIVIALNDSEREDTYYPDHKSAWKCNQEAIPCEVVDVLWQVGRTGRCVPVVNIIPTIIDGVEVSKATGFNAKFIKDNCVDKGGIVNIYRSGSVIPYIDSVEVTDTTYSIPSSCPSCGSPLTWKGVDIVCTNTPFQCPDRAMQILEYYLITLGAENITATTLKKIGVNSIQSLYELDEFEIAELDGFGTKRAEQIIFEISKTLKTTPDKLLASFGITGIGLESARSILKKFDFDSIWNLSEKELLTVDGIGDKLAYNFVVEIYDYKELYEYLKSIGLRWSTLSNTLRGNIFTLTGDGPIKRDEIIKMVENSGGIVKNISKKTNFLVTNDPDTNTGKAKKAREYGVPVISYDKLLEMIGE